MMILIFGATVITNVIGTIFIKLGSSKISGINLSWASIWNILSNWHILLGIALYAGSFPAYSYILQKMSVSVVYPIFTSLSFAGVILISVLFLKESLTLVQFAGLALVIGGIVLLSTGAAK
jgi:small multidrug resistance pump